MWGAIAGDIIGSRFEFRNLKSKEFELFTPRNYFTDDSVMTIAVAKTLHEHKSESTENIMTAAVQNMTEIGKRHPDCGYGGSFYKWVMREPKPYGSYGNGAAMRVSYAGYAGETEEEVKRLSYAVTAVSHNHPEGLKGAECVALAVFWARTGVDKTEIKKRVAERYYPQIGGMSCDNIRPANGFNETCQGSVPQALVCFFEGVSYEDTVRNAVSIGGDTDTIAAMAGSVAEAYFGLPEEIRTAAERYLTPDLLTVAEQIVY